MVVPLAPTLPQGVATEIAGSRSATETELNILDASPHIRFNFDRAPDELQQRLCELTNSASISTARRRKQHL